MGVGGPWFTLRSTSGYAWSSTFGAFYKMTMCWVCNRAAVVDGGCIRLSRHSRLRRQYGVIHNVTARAVNIAENQMATIMIVGAYGNTPKSLSQKPQNPQRWVIGSLRFIGFIRFFCVNQRFLREAPSSRGGRRAYGNTP